MSKQLRQTIQPAFILGATGSAETDSLGYFSLLAGSGITLTPASGSLTIAVSNAGTVTSVELSLPSLFTVTGSPVTGSGSLTATLATQAANQVFVGPTTGANAAPTFRALVVGDIPTLTAAKISDFDTQVRTNRLDQLAQATQPVTFGSNVTVTGDLTVNGTTTTINSTTVSVNDKNLVLGDVDSPASPTDAGADGGGITLKGTTDKSLNWVDATDAWTSSEHLNLLTGKAFYINGTSVLNASTLGSGVTASSLTSVGSITTGTWSATAIAATRGGTGLTTVPKGSVLIANTLDTISALDGGGSVDGILAYDAASDTISWAITIDGGTF
jgi:hypothetical protein